jgi:inhibitor of KinA sporulation pathway (predicted exonuclease)
MKNFIVFDLEWNQNPGGKEASVERLPFEIFEIGAVKLNEEREKVAEFHRIIRPCVYRQMHRIISEVTHVSIEELERDGEPFAAVMEDFLKWCGEDCIFCTWGSMDLTELQRNMVYHGMTIPFPKPFLFYDVQKLYSLCYQDGKARISLDEAVESFALDVDAPFHRALGDAEYTGRVLQAMDFDSVKDYVSVDYYLPPESEDEEFTLRFPEYTKFVSQMFETKEEAMEEKRVTDHLHEMPSDAAEEDPLVFLRTALLSVSCNMSGTRYDERKDPDEKVGGRQSFCRKDGKTGG